MRTDPNSMAYKAVIQEMHAAGDTMSHTDALLQNRQTTHGSFVDNARIAQALKQTIHAQDTWHTMTPIQREALDFICSKLARICSGQAGYSGHWEDVAGYAELARQETAQATLR
jgi:hypothetical protein